MDEKLIWFNALAFLSKGKLAISYALAQQSRTAHDSEISVGALRLMDHLQKRGVPTNSPVLKNPWVFRPFDMVVHCVLLVALPFMFFAVTLQPATSDKSGFAYASSTSPPIPPSTQSSNIVSAQPVVPPEPPVAKCSLSRLNGDVLDQLMPPRTEGHVLEIKNGSGGNAIIKVRNAYTGRLLFSFFVQSNSSASYNNIPDGTYRIQYAIGDDLRADCKSFVKISGLGQFPEPDTLSTTLTPTQVITQRLSYTLYPVPGGNVRPQAIDPSDFNDE